MVQYPEVIRRVDGAGDTASADDSEAITGVGLDAINFEWGPERTGAPPAVALGRQVRAQRHAAMRATPLHEGLAVGIGRASGVTGTMSHGLSLPQVALAVGFFVALPVVAHRVLAEYRQLVTRADASYTPVSLHPPNNAMSAVRSYGS